MMSYIQKCLSETGEAWNTSALMIWLTSLSRLDFLLKTLSPTATMSLWRLSFGWCFEFPPKISSIHQLVLAKSLLFWGCSSLCLALVTIYMLCCASIENPEHTLQSNLSFIIRIVAWVTVLSNAAPFSLKNYFTFAEHFLFFWSKSTTCKHQQPILTLSSTYDHTLTSWFLLLW